MRIVERVDIQLELLGQGELDVASIPSTVNLGDRLDERGLEHAEELGWESVYLDLEGAPFGRAERVALIGAMDGGALAAGFIREDGALAGTLHPGPGDTKGPWSGSLGPEGSVPASLDLAAPVGDELLELIQRVLQEQLADVGATAQLVNVDARTFYGAWAVSDPRDVALRRSAGAPGLADRRGVFARMDAMPLFQVETVLAWRRGVQGPHPNPTFEGPLWNLETWTHEAP